MRATIRMLALAALMFGLAYGSAANAHVSKEAGLHVKMGVAEDAHFDAAEDTCPSHKGNTGGNHLIHCGVSGSVGLLGADEFDLAPVLSNEDVLAPYDEVAQTTLMFKFFRPPKRIY